MSDLSDYLALELLDHVFNAAAYSVPTPYVSLHTASPGEDGSNEVAGGSYGRQGASFGTPFLDSGNSDTPTVQNSGTITFLNMPAVTVTHAGLWDAASGGNFLCRYTLAASVPVTAGEAATFSTGDLSFTLD